jgi:periplasmic protein TonB
MRFMMVLLPAAVLTFGLQMVMVTLIQFADGQLDQSPTIKLPDIFMPKAEIQTQRSVEKPEKPELDDTPPPDVPEQAFDSIDGNAAVGSLTGPSQVAANLDLSIGEYLPIVKVAPNYPRGALSRGLEGDVLLEYTVTRQGSVRDPVVLESTSPVFDQAAIESALRYKYKPRVVDGEAIEVPGVRTRVVFRLDRS